MLPCLLTANYILLSIHSSPFLHQIMTDVMLRHSIPVYYAEPVE